MTEERTHGLLSGSSAYIWTNCTGSVFLTKDLPEEPPTKDSIKGTECHSTREILLEDHIQHQLHGSDPDIRAHLLTEDDEVLTLAQAAKNLIWNRVFNGHVTGKAYGQEDRFVIDEKLGMYGHVDVWVIEHDDKAKRVLRIHDDKYGGVFVPVKKNVQLAFYAYAAREEIRRLGKDIDYAKVSIAQPKWEKDPFREDTLTNKQLDAWGKKFFDAAHQIFVKQKPKFKVGTWCTHCKAKGICPKYQGDLSKKTSLKLIEVNTDMFPKPEVVPDEVIKNVVLHAGDLTAWLKSCKAYVINRHKEGRPIPGTKIVQNTGKSTWIKTVDIAESLIAAGIENPYNKPKVIGITKAKSALSKILGIEKTTEVMQQLVTKTNPPLQVVGEDDPRVAVKDFVGMLSAVEEDEE